jgi:glycosyltransferase involved in cell wall biosynthesis
MKISVVLAVYNEDKYLQLCLESLSNQNGINYEVIVVDDGSFNKIKSSDFKNNKFKNLYFYRIKHNGTTIARNYGARLAKGQIFVFVDGDMEFDKNFLKDITKPIILNKTNGTFSTEEYVANWDNVWARCWNFENNLGSRRRIDVRRKDMKSDFRAILKTEFDRVKGFDDIGYTDTWTLVEKLGYFPTATKAIYYHYNPQNWSEVFWQAIWIGARKRRFGKIGKIAAAVRATYPFSLIIGLYKAIKYKEFMFIKFKFIYDLGIFSGIMNSLVNKKKNL